MEYIGIKKEESMNAHERNSAADIGLFLIRVGIGVMFVYHGLGKILAGPSGWLQVGRAVELFGISGYPEVWGLAAAWTELSGGVFLFFGVFFRPACFALMIVMAVASSMHLYSGNGLQTASHAIEAGTLFLGLLFIGPGKMSFSEELKWQGKEKVRTIKPESPNSATKAS